MSGTLADNVFQPELWPIKIDHRVFDSDGALSSSLRHRPFWMWSIKIDHETARREGRKIRTAGGGSALTGGLPKPAAEPRAQGYARCIRARCRKSLIRCITRLLTVTQELTRTRCRKVCTMLLRFCLFKRKTHPRVMQESPQMQMFANIGSVRRTRVQGTKGSAHVLPAWRRARSSRDLHKTHPRTRLPAGRKTARSEGDASVRERLCGALCGI